MYHRLSLFIVVACSVAHVPQSQPASYVALAPITQPGTSVTIVNSTPESTLVYIAFGADSFVKSDSWTFCAASSPLACSFTLPANSQRFIAPSGYLNATISFGGAVGCGTTKAELNLNNPFWFDIVDISLVDGFSSRMQITANSTLLGPVKGATDNETKFGVYPLGCDVCTARQAPPCGIQPGQEGCKLGEQYKPAIPCQYQGPTMGGGGDIVVELLP